MGRPRRIRFELQPQPPDEYPQILHLLGLRWPPDLAQQLAMRQHLAGMGHEMAEEFEFFRRELDLRRSRVTCRRTRSTVSSPDTNIGNSPCAWNAWRKAARSLAISSAMPNG